MSSEYREECNSNYKKSACRCCSAPKRLNWREITRQKGEIECVDSAEK